jgi:hypothetical protein
MRHKAKKHQKGGKKPDRLPFDKSEPKRGFFPTAHDTKPQRVRDTRNEYRPKRE